MAGYGSPPGVRNGGRQAGTPNKLTADIKAMVIGALHDVGGRAYLAARALDQPVAFMGLVGRVLPLQVTGENGKPLAVKFEWGDAPSQKLTLEAKPNGEIADADTGALTLTLNIQNAETDTDTNDGQ